ncbi:hypothetical protein ACJMK2_035451 [Sinanodonta woodiana]|uniref:Uncharacterized protein n=1 Tax=Sinanodonta woodiana TaxID=1069815 RepID=A0ABD3WV00_SINWO
MKCHGLYLMASIVSCLMASLLFTAEAFVTDTSSGGNGSSLLLLMLFLFPFLRSNKKTVVAIESDHDFYNRVVCQTGTPAPNPNCLTCFDHSDATTCAADLNCVWNAKNNLCIPM